METRWRGAHERPARYAPQAGETRSPSILITVLLGGVLVAVVVGVAGVVVVLRHARHKRITMRWPSSGRAEATAGTMEAGRRPPPSPPPRQSRRITVDQADISTSSLTPSPRRPRVSTARKRRESAAEQSAEC